MSPFSSTALFKHTHIYMYVPVNINIYMYTWYIYISESTAVSSILSPKRECSSKGNKVGGRGSNETRHALTGIGMPYSLCGRVNMRLGLARDQTRGTPGVSGKKK